MGPPIPQPALFNISRGAANVFGIFSYGIHVNGFTWLPDKEQPEALRLHMWVARRSREKPTWPGRLDHIVAGGQVGALSI